MRAAGLARNGGAKTAFLALAAAVAAGALDGSALSVGAAHGATYLWAGPVAAVPVAIALAWRSLARPASVALAIVGLLAFSASLAVAARLAVTPQPVPLALGAVVSGGLVLLAARVARPGDLLEGLALAYAGSAFIFEMAIVVHNV